MTVPNLSPLGDTCITLRLGEGISAELSERAVEQAAAVREAGIAGVTDVVPSYATVTIFYDPRAVAYVDLRDRLINVVGGMKSPATEIVRKPRKHRIPVSYDGADLEDVAGRTGLTKEEVIRIHSGAEYRVFVIGFVPGFAYLGPLDSRLILPRREFPRTRVPAGSVAIAEAQTGIYPSETPGGWHLIGTTRARMFDASRNPPALLAVGDIVTFVAA